MDNQLMGPMRRYLDVIAAACLMLVLLAAMAAIWFPLLPNEVGKVPADYAAWLPIWLAGYFWYLHNGLFSVPWFSPSECAGIPFYADPQIGYWTLPQLLSFVMDPLSAARAAWMIYGAAGFWGAWHLCRRAFLLSVPSSLLAASLFLLNGFFSTRMAVSHLTFAPFMLLPALCATLLRPPGASALSYAAVTLRSCLCGLLVAVAIQAGMAVVLPQFFAAAVAMMLLHAALFGWQRLAWLVLAAGTAIGAALSASKLVAGFALLANFPRDYYPLPGLPGPFATLYVALRALFWPFGNDLRDWVVHSRLILEPHEFAYGVGLIPPLLMLAALAFAVRKNGVRACRPRHFAAAITLAALLALPLALNLYEPGWNDFLKSLPILGNSSNLLRWLMLLILPAIIGGALAADRLAAGNMPRAIALTAAGIAVTLGCVTLSDRSPYGSNGQGVFDPSDLVQAWQQAHDTGAPPPIKGVAELFDNNHQILMSLDRQNGMVHGFSTLSCYDALFGYRLEKLPIGKIRLASAFPPKDGLVNFKNPACYVYPAANQCLPGDEFTEAQAAEARKFLDYDEYSFSKPVSAILAGWLSLLTLFATLAALGWSTWRLR